MTNRTMNHMVYYRVNQWHLERHEDRLRYKPEFHYAHEKFSFFMFQSHLRG